MQERHQNKKVYFEEQANTTKRYVVPFIEQYIKLDPTTRVLEIGCGEGGNLLPFLDQGCQVTGVDISESKISHAMLFLEKHPNAARLRLIARDIYETGDDLKELFDLIIMRDVIEHIHDQDRFMGYVKRFLKPDGLFFLAFPPWYNPFGGHQQICENKILSKLPYFHLFPPAIYKLILKIGGESSDKTMALAEIKETGISIERFRKLIKKHRYLITNETFYLVNPNYEIKFGLKPRKQLPFIARIRFIRNLFTTSCYYLIRMGNECTDKDGNNSQIRDGAH